MIKSGDKVWWKVKDYPDAHGIAMRDEENGTVLIETGNPGEDGSVILLETKDIIRVEEKLGAKENG